MNIGRHAVATHVPQRFPWEHRNGKGLHAFENYQRSMVTMTETETRDLKIKDKKELQTQAEQTRVEVQLQTAGSAG